MSSGVAWVATGDKLVEATGAPVGFVILAEGGSSSTDVAAILWNCPVRAAQQRVVAEGFARQGPDTDVLAKINEHFAFPEALRHGAMWADILLVDSQSLGLVKGVRR